MSENILTPKIIIAIKSCVRDELNGANEAIRQTWGAGLDNLHFFTGRLEWPRHKMSELKADTQILNCPDNYEGLPEKTLAILKFSAACFRFDFIALFDTDTYVVPSRLLSCGFENYDLTGNIGGNTDSGKYFSWPSGGAGYCLSARAARKILLAQPSKEWAEDRLIGQILGPYIKQGDLTMLHHPGFGADQSDTTDITTHFCARGLHRDYDPKWMYEMHERNKVTK